MLMAEAFIGANVVSVRFLKGLLGDWFFLLFFIDALLLFADLRLAIRMQIIYFFCRGVFCFGFNCFTH
jgi:hypothetical protein